MSKIKAILSNIVKLTYVNRRTSHLAQLSTDELSSDNLSRQSFFRIKEKTFHLSKI